MGGHGEVFRGQRGAVCQYFEQGGAAVTEGGQIMRGFCDLYSQAGPKLPSRLDKERRFLQVHGEASGGVTHLETHKSR